MLMKFHFLWFFIFCGSEACLSAAMAEASVTAARHRPARSSSSRSLSRSRRLQDPAAPSTGGAAERLHKCIGGERDCNFTSPLSSKALCLAGLVRLLDDMPRVNSGYGRGKMRLRVLVGLKS